MEPAALDEFARSYAEAWSSQEPARVAAHFAENGVLQINRNEPAVGRAALEDTAASFMSELPDLVLSVDGVSMDGDTCIFRWTLVGTSTGPGGSGNRVHISGHEEWTFGADGLILRSQGHMDLDDYARQLSG